VDDINEMYLVRIENYKNFNSANLYKNFSPIKVMNKFKKICNNKNFSYKMSAEDFLFVLLYQIKQKYYYIRHKIYHHYFNFFKYKNQLYNA
jgi:hypothetical protein